MRFKRTLFFLSIIFFVFFSASFLTAAGRAEDDRDYLEPVRRINREIRERLGKPAGQLDIDLIMEGTDFYGTMPYHIRWDSDGSRFWFRWKQWHEKEMGTYEYNMAAGSLNRLPGDQAERVPGAAVVWDEAHRFALWRAGTTVWLYDGKSKKSTPVYAGIGEVPRHSDYTMLGDTYMAFFADSIGYPEYVPGAVNPIAFTKDSSKAVLFYNNNLLSVDIRTKGKPAIVRQITDIRPGFAPGQDSPSKAREYYKKLQLEMFDVINRRHENRKNESSVGRKGLPAAFYLKDWSIFGIFPSPGLDYTALILMRSPAKNKVARVPSFNTISGYTELLTAYPKAADDPPEFKLGIMELKSGSVGWSDFGFKDKKLGFLKVKWSPDGEKLLVGFFDMTFKNACLGVLTPAGAIKKTNDSGQAAGSKDPIDPAVSSLKLHSQILAHDRDEAWVHPLSMSYAGWYPDGKKVWFSSERSGFLHLYSVFTQKGGKVKALTSGNYLIFRPRVTPDRDAFLLNAEIPDPFEMQTYLLPIAGGKLQALTSGFGRTEGKLSPHGRYLAYVASSANQPWELYVKPREEPGPGTKITRSPAPAFTSYDWAEPEIIHFPARDGSRVPARLYRPAVPHPARPAVIFCHGAGWLHNVHRWWASYAHEYCFHHLLMARGYTVLDIDFRGSAGYGRDWRTAIYLQELAGKTSDVVDGSRYLVKSLRTDPERIGIYGGSGGGVMTLMALFKAPKDFGAGASLRTLPDMAHYHFMLPRMVLGDPLENPGAYRSASPIYHAEGLADPLLICHGLSDVNTHFHGIARMIQRLIELRKTGWDLAVYPMESHSFVEPSSWADEYRRILRLFETNLKKKGGNDEI